MSILITYNNSINSKNIPNIMIIMKIVYNINWNLTFADRMYVFFFGFCGFHFLYKLTIHTINSISMQCSFISKLSMKLLFE